MKGAEGVKDCISGKGGALLNTPGLAESSD
jgi:hypothetical protein